MIQLAGAGLEGLHGVVLCIHRVEEPCVPVQRLVVFVVEVVHLLLQRTALGARASRKRVVKEGGAGALGPDDEERGERARFPAPESGFRLEQSDVPKKARLFYEPCDASSYSAALQKRKEVLHEDAEARENCRNRRLPFTETLRGVSSGDEKCQIRSIDVVRAADSKFLQRHRLHPSRVLP